MTNSNQTNPDQTNPDQTNSPEPGRRTAWLSGVHGVLGGLRAVRRPGLVSLLALVVLLGTSYLVTGARSADPARTDGTGGAGAGGRTSTAATARPAAPAPSPSGLPTGAPTGTPSPGASGSPSGSVSPSPTQRLPGVPDVATDKLPELAFEVPLPATWTCRKVPQRLTGNEFSCVDNPAKPVTELRLLWRNCPEGCGSRQRISFGMDWQVEWFDDVQRFDAYGPNAAAQERRSTTAVTYSTSLFYARGAERNQLVQSISGPANQRDLLRAIVDQANESARETR